MTLFPLGLGLNPTIQSPSSIVRRIAGLQQASVQYPKNGFGAKPESQWQQCMNKASCAIRE
jgi:hypothetical protein